MTRFLSTTALAVISVFAAQTAQAACDAVSGITAGATVTCDASSIETRGIAGSGDGITVAVEDGATLDTTASGALAIDLGASAGSEVNNAGSILSGETAIQAGDRLDVNNDGNGIIEAVGKAIDANGDRLSVVNEVDARITSTTDEGIETGNNAAIRNFGVIEGFDDAIQVGESAFIENYGTIRNTQTLADVDPATPGVEGQDAIDIDSGQILNVGLIHSTTNAAIDFDPSTGTSLIVNQGTIRGTIAVATDAADTAAQVILNQGTLEGTSGLALDLGKGDDALSMSDGARIIGGVNFGSGADVLSLESSFVFDAGFATAGLFDGGAGDDLAFFAGLGPADFALKMFGGDEVTFLIGGAFELKLKSFEVFRFGGGAGGEYAFADLPSLVAPVPVPASLLLLGSGLAGVVAMGRRRKAKAKAA